MSRVPADPTRHDRQQQVRGVPLVVAVLTVSIFGTPRARLGELRLRVWSARPEGVARGPLGMTSDNYHNLASSM